MDSNVATESPSEEMSSFHMEQCSHRIARSVVLALRNRGGLGASDFIKCYYASHLWVLTSWTSRMAPIRWSEIEMSITAPVHPYGHPLENICLK